MIEVDRDIVRRAYEAVDFEDLLGDLVSEIEQRNYEITRISNIDAILDRKVTSGPLKIGFRRFKIVTFCNLESCSQLISQSLLAGVFMPVRFIVFQDLQDNAAQIAFLKPTAFARLFDSKPLLDVAASLEKDMNDILDELAF